VPSRESNSCWAVLYAAPLENAETKYLSKYLKPMPEPIDSRKKPIEVKVHVASGAGVDITWSDGHTSHYDFPYLRENCPCAMCNDEREKSKSFATGSGASSGTSGGAGMGPPNAFPMFKPKITAKSAHAVGNYAVQILFSDGHSTGIYSFDRLREMCPCERCQQEFRSVNNESRR